MESKELITLGVDNKHASPTLDDPNGNEANSVGIEAVKMSMGTTCFDLDADEASLITESVIVSDDANNVKSAKTVEHRNLTSKGVKRPRLTSDEQPPSVQVIFNSLTSQSKKKLEELLQQWSQWDAKHFSAQSQGSDKALESGESTYYPALNVGVDKPSTVTFWMDHQTSKMKEGNQMDDEFVPVYDRGYASALTSGDGHSHHSGDGQLVDDSRCFNCGSYNHSLKECTKRRDHAAVKNARKKHKSKRNQNPDSRTPTRYYQNTVPGKYDGLQPGVLEPDTRKLLGLGELDPPPWLDRMRELGYPPGYMEEDVEAPSGLTIFGEEEIKEDKVKEDGEMQDMELSPPLELPTLPKKMSVDFPGINAPIPDNADKRRWAPADSLAYQSTQRFNSPSDSTSRDQFRGSRWSRDSRDDCSPGVDTSYSSRYASYNPTDNFQSPRRGTHFSRSTSFERSEKDTSSRHHENSRYNPTDNIQSPRRGSNIWRSPSYERTEKDRTQSTSNDHRKHGDDRDRYTDSSSSGHGGGGRHKRYKRS